MIYQHQKAVQPTVFYILVVWYLLIFFSVLYLKEINEYGESFISSNITRTVIETNENTPMENSRIQNYNNNNNQSSQPIKACILILIRDSDFNDLNRTIPYLEKNFNHKYHYPYVFLNNEPHSDSFKDGITQLVNSFNSSAEFGIIPTEHWSIPKWIDKDKLNHSIWTTNAHVMRGHDWNYHLMCRFYSGFFFRHELTLKYDYYMRIDPHVIFPCPFNEDPFQTLIDSGKVYGFALAAKEDVESMPSLWEHIRSWMNTTNVSYSHFNDILERLQDKGCSNIVCCLDRIIFYNNFEVSAFSVWRDPTYLSFFDFLDKSGGFLYERWGDAPTRTFYLLAMHGFKKVHRYEQIGYFHHPEFNWPKDNAIFKKCDRSMNDTTDFIATHCTTLWDSLYHNLTLGEIHEQIWGRQ